jgi:hypothetical protein
MAAVTAAALYPVKGVKVPAFNMGARDFFEALADALGYARSNIVELFRYLRKPEVMNELARSNDRLREALTGENCKFISDVISSARLPLAALNRPEVARVFAPDPDTPQPHFREKEVVWVCIPQDSEDVALLAGAIVHNLYNRVVKGRRGTYFLVDEAGSTITIENLDRYLQVGRGWAPTSSSSCRTSPSFRTRSASPRRAACWATLASSSVWGKSQDTETRATSQSFQGTSRSGGRSTSTTASRRRGSKPSPRRVRPTR